MNLKQELLSVARIFNQEKIPYALCGGMAVVLHGYPRLTRDIDILIQAGDLDRARSALDQAGFKIPGGIIPFDAGKPQERNVFRVSKALGPELLTVDLLLLPPFLQVVWDGREIYEIEGVPLGVVSLEGLIQMKRVAGRPQDKIDVENLKHAGDET